MRRPWHPSFGPGGSDDEPRKPNKNVAPPIVDAVYTDFQEWNTSVMAAEKIAAAAFSGWVLNAGLNDHRVRELARVRAENKPPALHGREQTLVLGVANRAINAAHGNVLEVPRHDQDKRWSREGHLSAD